MQTTSSDNTTTLSNVIAIKNNEDDVAAAISLYPNPVKDMLQLKRLNADMRYKIKIVKENGNVVAAATIKNNTAYNLNVQRLSKGVYYVNMTCQGGDADNITIKFLKD